MTDNDKKFIAYWQKHKDKGIIRFSLVTGVTYGLFVVIFSKVFAWDFTFTQNDLGYAILSLVVGVMGLAPFLWWHRNRKYNQILAKNPNKKKKSKK
jgi:hypothetical protein